MKIDIKDTIFNRKEASTEGKTLESIITDVDVKCNVKTNKKEFTVIANMPYSKFENDKECLKNYIKEKVNKFLEE